MKLSSDYYKNYDIDDKGKFVYNHKLVNTLDDLDYLDTDLYLNHLEEEEKQETLRKKKYEEFLRTRKLSLFS
tara:strand:+ start:5172 stop:5387 length:216 start_codon:yes stop_codon:yes gene_type:complete